MLWYIIRFRISNKKMKKFLCYGDSNTFGYNAKDGSRYNQQERWSGILKTKLQGKFEIIEEGCTNRTGFVDNPESFEKSGLRHFPELMKTIDSVDVLIIALGTNDLQKYFDVTEEDIYRGFKSYISVLKKYNNNAKIIIIPPVLLNKDVLNGTFAFQYERNAIEKSAEFIDTCKNFAAQNDCDFFDFNEFAKPDSIDGLHYNTNSHSIIAQKLLEFIEDKIKEYN